jgi:ribosomal protein S18 acetylase RimI-like enzyme
LAVTLTSLKRFAKIMSDLVQLISGKVRSCKIREYCDDDREQCLELYRSNEPAFIPEGHIDEYEGFLSGQTSYYLVIEGDDRLIGCGGIELPGDTPEIAWLTFGMIHRDFHKKGYGSSLLAARISLLTDELELRLETGLPAVGFYAQYGFRVESVIPNRLGEGNDYGNLILDMNDSIITTMQNLVIEKEVTITLNNEAEQPDGGSRDDH